MSNWVLFFFLLISIIAVFSSRRNSFTFLVPFFAFFLIGIKTSFVFFGIKELLMVLSVGVFFFILGRVFPAKKVLFSYLSTIFVLLFSLIFIC
ncbi:MAG: hypothetical protein J7L42_05610 [Elusimicrobia bacterium]|nr:hypothetical protein [Elusimicrobiota bacterium]